MGMPQIDCMPIKKESALTSLLQSIALQEAALVHILNAEGEKIQRVVCEAKCVDDLLNVNESVTNTIQAVITLEEMLKDKAIAVIDELSGRVC